MTHSMKHYIAFGILAAIVGLLLDGLTGAIIGPVLGTLTLAVVIGGTGFAQSVKASVEESRSRDHWRRQANHN